MASKKEVESNNNDTPTVLDPEERRPKRTRYNQTRRDNEEDMTSSGSRNATYPNDPNKTHPNQSRFRVIMPSDSSNLSGLEGQRITPSTSRSLQGDNSVVGNIKGLGPTQLPPVHYQTPGSPYKQKKRRQYSGTIPREQLDSLTDRMDKLEVAFERYVEHRAEKALAKSVLPGLDGDEEPNSDDR